MSGANNPSLYEIEAELARLDELLEAAGGDLEAAAAADAASQGTTAPKDIVAWLEKYEWAERNKIDNYGRFWRDLESCIDIIEAEEERLTLRRQALQNKIKNLKKVADWGMTRRGLTKLEGATFTIAKQKNGGKPGIELKVMAEQLPEKHQRKTITPNMDSIRAALEAGDKEMSKIAELKPVGYSIRLR